jgi:hypothetical protein
VSPLQIRSDASIEGGQDSTAFLIGVLGDRIDAGWRIEPAVAAASGEQGRKAPRRLVPRERVLAATGLLQYRAGDGF